MKVLATKTIAIMTRSLAVFAVLAGLYLSSNSIISNAYAANDTESVQASVTVPDACYISGTNYNHTGSVSGGSYNTDFGGISTVTVQCNDRNGYSVYAVGYTGNNEGSTDLVGTNPNLTIPTGTGTSTSTSHWAMKIGASTSTFAPTILNGYNNYNVVPSTATKVVTYTSDINFSGDSKFTTSYAVAVAPSQAADTYTGKVKYTIVHPNYSNADGSRENYNVPVTFAGQGVSSVTFTATGYPTRTVSTSGGTANLTAGVTYTATATIASGYEFVSWALNNANYGTLSSTSTNPTTFTPNASSASASLTITGKKQAVTIASGGNMQDISSKAEGGCPATLTTGQVYELTDTRGGSTTYKVARLEDGNCWMLDNLRLGSTSAITLDSSNTNLPSNVSWTLPASGTVCFGSGSCTGTDGTTTGTSYTVPAINAASKDAVASKKYGDGSGIIGVYYNYCAASAGGICTNSSLSNASADRDICPKGWRLPTGNDSGEYGALYIAYSSDYTNLQSALSTPLSGYFINGSAGGQGSFGYFWSATRNDGTSTYCLRVGSAFVDPARSNLRYTGQSVRCILK